MPTFNSLKKSLFKIAEVGDEFELHDLSREHGKFWVDFQKWEQEVKRKLSGQKEKAMPVDDAELLSYEEIDKWKKKLQTIHTAYQRIKSKS